MLISNHFGRVNQLKEKRKEEEEKMEGGGGEAQKDDVEYQDRYDDNDKYDVLDVDDQDVGHEDDRCPGMRVND